MTLPIRLVLSIFAISAFSVLVGCDDPVDRTTEPAAPVEEASETLSSPSPSPDAASPDTTRGTLSLTVNGEEKAFTHFPDDRNLAMSMSTMIVAQPSDGNAEEFSIAVMSFDLSEAELPISLKIGMREAMESEDPTQFANMPKPLISYLSADGVDYSSYATIVFESYENGVATGSVEDIELEPSDGDGPAIMLSDIRFEVPL
jgi:hypothetical protein